MGLICSRIGCREKAAASLQFDADRSTAVLIDLTHARNGMPLCERHASSRTAPIGWQLVDRRTGAKKIEVWSAEDDDVAVPRFSPPTARPSARRPRETPHRRAEDRVDDEAGTTAPEAVTAEAAPVRPRDDETGKEAPTEGFRWPKHGEEADDTEDEAEGLGADSPLLSRAFRAAK